MQTLAFSIAVFVHMIRSVAVYRSFLLFLPEDTYERTLTVDGEETTLVVMDTWENDRLVQCKCNTVNAGAE